MENKTILELEELAVEGNENAAKELVRRYTDGDGVPVDLDVARTWEEYIETKTDSSKAKETNITIDEISETHSEGCNSVGSEKEESGFNWYEQKRQYEKMSNFELRQAGSANDPIAKFILGERYLWAETETERKEGTALINEAIVLLKDKLTNENNEQEEFMEVLVSVYKTLGNYYQRQSKDSNRINTDDKNVLYEKELFDCYSNIYELTSEITDELIMCYEKGIGVQQNENKVAELLEKSAMEEGIIQRVKYADYCMEKGAYTKALEWFEAAKKSKDVSEHEAACLYIDIRKTYSGVFSVSREQLDDAEKAKQRLKKMADDNDTEAKKYSMALEEKEYVDPFSEEVDQVFHSCYDTKEYHDNSIDNWERIEARYSNYDLYELRSKYDKGDLIAGVFLGERYLESDSWVDKNEGVKVLEKAIEQIKNNFGFEYSKETLVHALCKLGGFYRSILDLNLEQLDEVMEAIIL